VNKGRAKRVEGKVPNTSFSKPGATQVTSAGSVFVRSVLVRGSFVRRSLGQSLLAPACSGWPIIHLFARPSLTHLHRFPDSAACLIRSRPSYATNHASAS